MDWQPKDSVGAGYVEQPEPAATGRAKRWVLHGGHGDCVTVGTASASEGPHLARLRGFRGWGRGRDRDQG